MRKKYKRDYIILESKDVSFRLKDKALPKAFAKLEVKEEKGSCMIYVENLKYTKEGYRIVVIEEDLNAKDVGRVLINENGKGEFVLNFNEENLQVKGIALTHNKEVPLIGFKGEKIDNYYDILFKSGEEEKNDIKETRMDMKSIIESKEDVLEIDEEYISRKDKEIKEEMDIKNLEEELKNDISEEELEQDLREIEVEQDVIEENIEIERKEPEDEKKKEEERQENQEEEISENKVYLVPRKIKKFLNKYKEVKPFIKEIDDTRWWKIDINPMSICGYVMPYLGYINYINYIFYSDITTLAYKYRHYIFGIKYHENGKRKYYVYGIPGTRYEQPDDGDTGFSHFIPCDKKNDIHGYWLCFIDCKSRLIAMHEE